MNQALVCWLAIATGGACGALARHLIHLVVVPLTPRFVPAGTLVANVLGCLLIGVLMARVQQAAVSDVVRLFVITGFLGSLTTFSTFGYQTLALIQEDSAGVALANVGLNLGLGLGAVYTGLRLAAG